MSEDPLSWQVEATRTICYQISESPRLLDPQNRRFARAMTAMPSAEQLIVLDSRIQHHYGQALSNYLVAHEVQHRTHVIAGGERAKTIGAVLRVSKALSASGAMRASGPPVVLGGGVALDVVGLAASLYRRGIPYVRVPTSLLAMVDVSVALKTGVNFGGYRNRLGAYHPPTETLIDYEFLRTLPARQFVNGLGEVLKLAIISNPPLFHILEQNGRELHRQAVSYPVRSLELSAALLQDVVRRAISGMITELEGNLLEERYKRNVDYGHTFSPLIEMKVLPRLLHGEAVTIDCILTALISVRRGLLDDSDFQRIVRCARAMGLPLTHPAFCNSDLLWQALEDVVRHRNGQQNLPIPVGIGQAIFLNDLKPVELVEASKAMGLLD